VIGFTLAIPLLVSSLVDGAPRGESGAGFKERLLTLAERQSTTRPFLNAG